MPRLFINNYHSMLVMTDFFVITSQRHFLQRYERQLKIYKMRWFWVVTGHYMFLRVSLFDTAYVTSCLPLIKTKLVYE